MTTLKPPPAAVDVPGMGTAWRSVVARATAHMEWGAATLLVICLIAALPLYALSAYRWSVGALSDARLGAAGATVWAAMAGYVALRRRLGPRDSGTLIGVASTVMVVLGTGFDDLNVRWMCAAALVVVPVASAMLLRARGVALTTAVAVAGVVAISLSLPAPPVLRGYAALTMVAMVVAPISVVTILVRRMQAARDLARTLAVTDPLTGLANRRGIEERAGTVLRAAAAAGEPVTVMAIDLDHFKNVNDTHGHAVGDRVLTAVAHTLTRVARADDLLVRLGGEELGWIASFPAAADVVAAAERLRTAVHETTGSDLPAVSVSVGVATAHLATDSDPAAAVLGLLSTADRALYAAKRAGRDRVVHARPSREPAFAR
ncbi:GGDEF domain-containing protein [Modestobacter italicus]|uniref:GGDEF domain-containing protein n=1 Tax=Modestobacter italicus (strain DSM 44449 / CECT 9708 / BC 501) TaxID=2732864 RepID=UPI001C978E35|nr:GGDEF domain-containing protein [Modestobacter italicus]